MLITELLGARGFVVLFLVFELDPKLSSPVSATNRTVQIHWPPFLGDEYLQYFHIPSVYARPICSILITRPLVG